MLTIEVKLNGKPVAEAILVPCGGIVADGAAVTDDFHVQWLEDQGSGIEMIRDADDFRIWRHSRGQTVWALVAKTAATILGQKIERMENKG